MSRSNRLTLREIRRVHMMMEQVAELGGQPHLWREHLMDETRRLVRARVAISMDCTHAAPGASPQLIAPQDLGWEPRDRERFLEYFRSGQVSTDPAATALFAAHQRTGFITATRRRLADDRDWYMSPTVSEARHSANIDDFVCSSVALAPGVLQGFIFYRDWGDEPFSTKERRLLRYAHVCLLRRLQDGALAHRRITAEFDLSPRLREILQLLLGGDGIKQIAHQLGISVHTVNGYVKTVYQRLNVRSRVELMTARRWYPKQIVLPGELVTAARNGHPIRMPAARSGGDDHQTNADFGDGQGG